MKRRLAIGIGLVGLGTVLFGARLLAQQGQPPAGQPVQPPRPPQTRIAVMNMLQVLKNYKKFVNMEAEMKNLQRKLEMSIEPYKANMARLQAEYKKPETQPERREQIEREMRKVQMDASVVEEDAKKELMKRSGEAFTTVYRDVEDAVGRYAQMNGYELVLFFNDRVDHDKYHPANVQQKLVTPAAMMPIYITPGMDITPHIIESLNRMYPPSAAAPGTPPNGTPVQPPPPAGAQR